MTESIFEIVRRAEDNYTNGTVTVGKYVEWSMYDTIETIEAYLNSKHISGSVDALGREKPFFNIVSAAANIWYRATDIDRKDIRLIADKNTNVVPAFMAQVLLQDWMQRERFGVFLNQWGRTLARYGSAVVKFVDKGDRLVPSVIPWNRLVVDPIDFTALPVIEKINKTPAQLLKMATKGAPEYAGYDMEVVKGLIETEQSRKLLDGQKQDNVNEFITIFEVHGEMSKSLLTGKDTDEDVYEQQMHVIGYTEKSGAEGYDDYTLYSGKEKESPYMITHLIEEDGRTLSIGAVEYLFDAQWMQNHTMKVTKDYLDLASKMIFQTSDTHFQGRNVLTAIENGDVMVYSNLNGGGPITAVNNSAVNITALQGFSQQWQVLAREVTSTPDSLRGNTMPSGTPYSLGAILQQQASSLFELMTENKGLAIEDMMREFVIPFLKRKMDTNEEITAILEDRDITQIDSMWVPREAVRRYNRQAVEDVINGLEPQEFNQMEAEAGVKKELAPLGNQRFFKPDEIGTATWKEVMKDFEWTVRVEVTNEMQDKAALLTTLSTVLQTVAGNPMILQDANARMLFSKILSLTGAASPLELSTSASSVPMVGGGTEMNMGAETPALPVRPTLNGKTANAIQ